MSRLATALLFTGASLMSGFASAQETAVAAIDVSPTAGGLTIVGRVLALADGDYEAQMHINKSGPSGSTRTTQGGAVSLRAGEEGEVATVGLSMAPGDRLVVDFVLTANGANVAVSTLSVGG